MEAAVSVMEAPARLPRGRELQSSVAVTGDAELSPDSRVPVEESILPHGHEGWGTLCILLTSHTGLSLPSHVSVCVSVFCVQLTAPLAGSPSY